MNARDAPSHSGPLPLRRVLRRGSPHSAHRCHRGAARCGRPTSQCAVDRIGGPSRRFDSAPAPRPPLRSPHRVRRTHSPRKSSDALPVLHSREEQHVHRLIIVASHNPDWRGWWGKELPFRVPVLVLTHTPRPPIEFTNGTRFEFHTATPDEALEEARCLAGSVVSDRSALHQKTGERTTNDAVRSRPASGAGEGAADNVPQAALSETSPGEDRYPFSHREARCERRSEASFTCGRGRG